MGAALSADEAEPAPRREEEEEARAAELREVRVQPVRGRLRGGGPRRDEESGRSDEEEDEDDDDSRSGSRSRSGSGGPSLSGSLSPDVSDVSGSFSDGSAYSEYSTGDSSDYTHSSDLTDSEEERERQEILDVERQAGQRFNVLAELADDDEEAARREEEAEQKQRAEEAEARPRGRNAHATAEQVLRRLYPAAWEQSDEFTALLTGHHEKHASLDFLVQQPATMDRFVRMTMQTAMRHAGRAQRGVAAGGSRKRYRWKPFNVRGLRWYITRLPAAYRFQFSLRVERVLNSNGLSLQMPLDKVLDPDQIASYFAPVFEPTVKRCRCVRPCHEMWDANPLSENFCPCMSPQKRRCTSLCGCAGGCELRHFDPALETFLVEHGGD